MYALPTPFAHCDIDLGDPAAFEPPPTILTETSPGRYQGIWEFVDAVEPKVAESVSRALTRRYGGDPGGWSITKFLRVHGSMNHKNTYNLPAVSVVHDHAAPIEAWPIRRPETTAAQPPVALLPAPAAAGPVWSPDKHSWWAVVAKYRRRLRPRHVALMTADAMISGPNKRSQMIFVIAAELYDAGAQWDEIAAVVWRSPYFIDKHGKSIDRLDAELSRI